MNEIQSIELILNQIEKQISGRFDQNEKHIDSRLDKLESALSILNSDNRENSKRIAEHSILIAQNKSDIDNLASNIRNSEKSCQTSNNDQHKKLFDKVDKIEQSMAFFRGALFLIPFILTLVYFFLNLYISKK